MTIEEIDLYWMRPEDLSKYLPNKGCAESETKNSLALAEMILARKIKASECPGIEPKLAETIDQIMTVDLHLPESDSLQQKIPEKLVEINSPDESSPVLLTGNSILTHKVLRLIFDAAKVSTFIIPVDTNGYTLDNSVVVNALTPMAVMRAVTESDIMRRTSSRKMIIPGLAFNSKSPIERVTRWSVEVGPVSGFELPLYLMTK
ncbi:MAG: hypothetical protein GX307_05180 [Euryarchaeota archaeon]|nr:hypothetical protein [Euryarchaeota archaeon]